MNYLERLQNRKSQKSKFAVALNQNSVALAPVWHVVVAGLGFIGAGYLFLTPNFANLGLAGLVLAALAALAAVAQLLIAVGLKKATPAARRAALLTNIFLIAFFSFMAFQIAKWIILFNLIGDAFYVAFSGLLVLLIGIAWWVVALRIRKRIVGEQLESDLSPLAIRNLKFLLVFKRMGQVIALIGALIWVLQFNPFTILALALSALFVPNPLAAAFVVLIGFSVLGMRLLLSENMSKHVKANQTEEEKLAGWLFVAPSLIGFMAFLAGPLLYSLVMSFFNWNGSSQMEFIGLDNYINTLGLQLSGSETDLNPGFKKIAEVFGLTVGALDPLFWKSMFNILIFLLTAVPLAVFPALILATLIEIRLPGSKIFRAIFFIPSVAGVIGVTLIWKQMLNSSVGFFNYAIQEIFLILNFVLPGDPLPTRVEIGWLSTEQWALAAVVVVFAWSQFGFNTVLFIAGLQSVSKELYEAAELDGANALQRFWNVTLPSLRPTTFFVTATTVILALQLFDVVFALNQPNVIGFPNNATLTPVVYLYQLGFQQGQFGKASAVAWVLFAVIFAFTLIQFNRQKKEAEAN
jgi:ABC-type sugar transport system permease subunit